MISTKRLPLRLGTLLIGLLLLGVVLWPLAAAEPSPAEPIPAAGPREALPRTITLPPARDNTLYQSEAGNISNGQGQHLFAGTTQKGELRRAVIAFDLSSIPPWADVVSATLALTMSKSIAGDLPVTLHTLTRDWGEGESDALADEGAGAAAAPGDATWLFNRYDTDRWAAPGGDFDPTPLATTTVGGSGRYAWTSADLLASVSAWVADPAGNFGWLVMGDEATTPSAKRFDSRENDPANRPSLTVTYVADVYALYTPVIAAP